MKPMENVSHEMMTVKQVAGLLGVCENTVRRLPIPYSQYVKGGRVIYQRQAVEQFKEENTYQPMECEQ